MEVEKPVERIEYVDKIVEVDKVVEVPKTVSSCSTLLCLHDLCFYVTSSCLQRIFQRIAGAKDSFK